MKTVMLKNEKMRHKQRGDGNCDAKKRKKKKKTKKKKSIINKEVVKTVILTNEQNKS